MRAILCLMLLLPCAVAADARIVGDRIEVTPAIAFVDQATPRPESLASLDAVAALLAAHPEIERLRITCGMDSRGAPEHARLQAEARARAVGDALMERHVDPLRIDLGGIEACDRDPGCARRVVLRIVTLDASERARLVRQRERRELFDAVGSRAVRCGGIRTIGTSLRPGVALSAACFFAPGSSVLRSEAGELDVQAFARSAAAHPARDYTIVARAADGAPRAWTSSAAQAAAIAEAAVRAGVAADRIAAGARVASDEEEYDGPAHLAPGEALIAFLLEPDPVEQR